MLYTRQNKFFDGQRPFCPSFLCIVFSIIVSHICWRHPSIKVLRNQLIWGNRIAMIKQCKIRLLLTANTIQAVKNQWFNNEAAISYIVYL